MRLALRNGKPMELVFNDKIMTLARYPNTGKIPIGMVLDKGRKEERASRN